MIFSGILQTIVVDKAYRFRGVHYLFRDSRFPVTDPRLRPVISCNHHVFELKKEGGASAACGRAECNIQASIAFIESHYVDHSCTDSVDVCA